MKKEKRSGIGTRKPYLALGRADEGHCSSWVHTLGFRLLNEHLDRFGWRSWRSAGLARADLVIVKFTFA